jgi:hypothetical protein
LVQRPDLRALLTQARAFDARHRLAPFFLTASLCTLMVFFGASANADSIYLKNGRVIHTSSARIDGDQVLFLQHGSEQSIPLSIVDRIEEDERQGPGTSGGRGAGGSGAAGADAAGSGGSVPEGTRSGAAPGGDLEGLTSGLESLSSLASLRDQLGGMASAQAGAQSPAQAMSQLQSIGADGLLPLADQLGTLSNLGALAGLDGEGTDLGKLGEVVPLIRRLGELLAAPNPSPEETMSTVEALLGGLGEMGVTSEMIEAEAARLGIPLSGIQGPGR